MVEVRKYHLHPTDRIPNSPRPLLHYKDAVARGGGGGGGGGAATTSPALAHCDPVEAWDLFQKNGWRVEWIFRYGPTQLSHYHSRAHECMAVLSGTATIRFGAADTSDDLAANTYGDGHENSGVEVEAEAGDVFVIPAGIAHKTYNTRPADGFKLLTPGEGRGIEAADARQALADDVEISGFTMMGAYCGGEWDFVVGGGGTYEEVWAVPKPELDPVFGGLPEGLCGTWPGGGEAARTIVF